MRERSEIYRLVRNLRQYVEWQAAALAGSTPAPAEERKRWEAAWRDRERARLDASLAEPAATDAAPAPTSQSAGTARPAQTAALWKDDSFGTRPAPTFNSSPDRSPAAAEAELRAVREELGECTRCGLCEGRTNIVFGVGNPDARLMFVGEAPGYHEDRQGEPFVGKAGALLDKMVGAMTLRREDVYIANVLKCRPPDNRDPAPDEIAKCSPFLKKQIAAIRPEVIVTTGKFASNLLTGNTGSLGSIRGRWHSYEGAPLMPTYHPAYLLRNPSDKGKAWDDLKKVMTRLEIEIPEKYR